MRRAYAEGWDRSTYGAPVSAGERRAIQAGQANAERVARAGARYRDAPGVALPFWDPAQRVAVLGFTTEVNPAVRQQLARELAGIPVAERTVEFDLRTLEQTAHELSKRTDLGQVTGLVVSHDRNRVILSTADAPSSAARSATTLPASVVVESGVPPMDTDDTRTDGAAPPRGGKYIHRGGPACSAGVIGAGNVGYFLVTAAHCSPQNVAWRAGAQNGYSIGTSHFSAWYNSTAYMDCDCMAIGPLAPGHQTLTFFADGSSTRTYSRTATAPEHGVGYLVCRTGYVSGYRCGYITSNAAISRTGTAGGVTRTLWYPVQTTAYACEGDSGGGFDNGGTVFMGLHHGSFPKGNDGFGNICTINVPSYGQFHSYYSRGYLIPSRVGVSVP